MKRFTWSAADKRAFADGQRLRAQTINSKRFDGPTEDEWDDEGDEDIWRGER